MTYKAYIKQASEGCDYTIGCARTVINIKADDMEEAKKKLYKKIAKNYTDYQELESCELYEINEVFKCDLKGLYKQIEAADLAAEQNLEESRERAEFERLSAKFGK